MTIQILNAELGIAATNAYIIADTQTQEAILIDPVDDAPFLHKMMIDAGWQVKLILATHAHFDHILASKAAKELMGAPFWTHQQSKQWLDSLPQQGRRFGLGDFPEAATPDRWLTDEPETIQIGSIALETIYTPGHAPDHIAYFLRSENILFVGDCVFEMSIGRTDLPGSNYEQLMQSITQKILPLGDDVHLLPGHGRETTIGRERRANPFILDYLG
ncbi:MAG: MBL fold metallo-hydrolase [Chloroflexi bacterium AL-W]|nr:MBL fold metallo-hydrolase [Chloroflexi bacterium AL-W]